MKWALRTLAGAVIATTSLFVHHLWERQTWNVAEAEMTSRVEKLVLRPDAISTRIAARDLVPRATECIAGDPASVRPYMLRASLFRLLARPNDAVADYRSALRFDRRAELFFNIGEAELEAGHPKEAYNAFLLTAFADWTYISEIPEPQSSLVLAALDPMRKTLRDRRPAPALFYQLQERIAAEGTGRSPSPE
jgi:hypothetical protein